MIRFIYYYPCYFTVLASVTGAIPFIGPYWVSVPAILELWLIRSSPIVAILAGVLFLIPPFLVDTVINSEIQGLVVVIMLLRNNLSNIANSRLGKL